MIKLIPFGLCAILQMMEPLLVKVTKLLSPKEYADLANINYKFESPFLLEGIRGQKEYLRDILDYSYVPEEDYEFVPENLKNELTKVEYFGTVYYTLDLTRYWRYNKRRTVGSNLICYKKCLYCGKDRFKDEKNKNIWKSGGINAGVSLTHCEARSCCDLLLKHFARVNNGYTTLHVPPCMSDIS